MAVRASLGPADSKRSIAFSMGPLPAVGGGQVHRIARGAEARDEYACARRRLVGADERDDRAALTEREAIAADAERTRPRFRGRRAENLEARRDEHADRVEAARERDV